jgi:hypothetical protein
MSKQLIIALISLLIVSGIVLRYTVTWTPTRPTNPTTAPTTTTVRTTGPATQPTPMRTMVDLALESDPHFPTTQPLAIPGDVADGSRLVIKEPVYLDPRRDLWITHANADPMIDVLRRAGDDQLHLTQERVRFAHYWSDEKDRNCLALIVESSPGHFEYVTEKSRRILDLPDPPIFVSAAAWKEKIVIPAQHGVYIVAPGTTMTVSYQKTSENGERAYFAFDPKGVLAWAPPKDGKGGSDGAFRFVDGAWIALTPAKNWPAKILHLIPLLDGSVLALREDAKRLAGVTLMPLDNVGPTTTSSTQPATIDEEKVTQLIEKLSDRDPTIREQTFAELARFGPGAFPIFEKLKASQPAGARLRLDELLRARLDQTLGTLRLESGTLEPISRFDDGGAVYYSEAGVTIFSENVGPRLYSPAYISVRPGRAVRMLPEFLVRDFAPGSQKLIAFADEWFITDEIQGPKRFMGNHFQKILRKREREFWKLIGVDRRGRWLFTNSAGSETLVLDPTLPNPTPKLPVWEYPVRKGEVGWTKDNWAAVRKGGAWVLEEKVWRPLDEKKEVLIAEESAHDRPRAAGLTTAPATSPSTSISTTNLSREAILTEKDGTQWFDGADHLIKVSKDGKTIDWELPGIAVGGSSTVLLFRVDEHRLLLFNQTARIVSLRETPGGREPFRIDAIFTDKIPDTDNARRIWQDPAGRVLIVIDDTLWILFPTGKVPEQLQNMMPAGSMSEEE